METCGDVALNIPELTKDDDVRNDRDVLVGDDAQNTANQFVADVARNNAPGNGSLEHVPQVPIATAQIARVYMVQRFWRSLRTSLDSVIKANSIAQVIPSAEAIS